MSVKISQRIIGDVVVLDVDGRITLGEGSIVFRDTIKELLAQGKRKILLNLSEVNYIDGWGNGELTVALMTVRNQGGVIKILNPTKKIRDLLQITKMYTPSKALALCPCLQRRIARCNVEQNCSSGPRCGVGYLIFLTKGKRPMEGVKLQRSKITRRGEGIALHTLSNAAEAKRLRRPTMRTVTLWDVRDGEAAALRSFEFSRICECPSCGGPTRPESLARFGPSVQKGVAAI